MDQLLAPQLKENHMKNNILLTLAFLLVSLSLWSQSKTATTRAVIIGISDYQNKNIPDLKYAHKDAKAFVSYLTSSAGGNLKTEDYQLLLNEKATTGQIGAALEWLVELSKKGDRAIIYFSGHGDVENKTMFNLGYLLSWDSPAKTYMAGALPLNYLQAIVSTLSTQNQVEVLLITDACRAGKLAGSSVSGTQLTNANLSKQFANEVKILSCQPNEFSLEGEQWGGGRGVFSFHLLDGLQGLADNNEDLKVNLSEIGRYLEDKVSTEAAPHAQFPMVLGQKNTRMAFVEEQALALLKEKRSKETPMLASIDSKGFENLILTEIDTAWQEKYQQFVAAMDGGQLLDATNGQPTAYELYLKLSKATELQALHGTTKYISSGS